jgi:hypothetical protein
MIRKAADMKKFIMLAILCSTSYALQAPYLYDAVSVGDTAVQLTWRNNATDYQGIIVLRKSGTISQYAIVDTAAGSATSFKDSTISPSTAPYFYALTAYSQAGHADTSNIDSIVIAPKPTDILVEPLNLVVSWDTSTNCTHIQFYDSSTVESGYRIYKSANFLTYNLIKDISSLTPGLNGTIIYTDSSVSPNFCYRYFVDTYKGQQTIRSVTDTVFTYDLGALARSIPKKCSFSNKLSSFPIKYKGWSLKSGDTIVLNETGAPETNFSIINVSNPNAPIFAGTGKSQSAMLGKASLTKGQSIFGTSLPAYDSLIRYKYSSGGIQVVSKLMIPKEESLFRYPASFFPGFISDSSFITMGTQSDVGMWTSIATCYSFNGSSISFVDSAKLNFGDHRTGFEILSSLTYKGRYYINELYGPLKIVQIVDYNISPKVNVSFRNMAPIEFPLIFENILVDAPMLKTANNIFVDTVKNLAFALSDTELAIYNCQIQTGIELGVSLATGMAQTLRFSGGKEGPQRFILLPTHNRPAVISIYDMSGKRIAHMEDIQGETVAWPHQNRPGVYIVKALLDGNSIAAKVAVTK